MVFFSPVGDRLSLLRDKESRQRKRATHQPAFGYTARRNDAPDAAQEDIHVPNRRLGSPCLAPSGLIGT